MASKSYDDVIGFNARRKTIQSFPRGLHTYFKNLKVIHIEKCGLKEIHQAELKPFPNLEYFFLSSNSIEVIEEGLFDNNPSLKTIGLWESRIVHIDSKVFDRLPKLRYLCLPNIFCVKMNIWNSREEVLEALKVIKNQCTSADYRTQKERMDKLEMELQTLNSEEIKEKIRDFESTFNSSIFFKFRPLRNRMLSLKNPKSVESLSTDRPSIDLVSKVSLDDGKSPNVTNLDAVCQGFNETIISEFGQVKNLLSELKIDKNVEFKDKLAAVNEKLGNIDDKFGKFDEKMDLKFANFDKIFKNVEEKLENFGSLKEQLTEFEVKNAAKLDKIEQEFANTRHKITINFNEKIKEIEKRLVSKFEEILEEKLEKLIEDKLSNILDAKLKN